MTADVAQLNLTPLNAIDYSNYKDGAAGSAPPPEGKYFGRVGTIEESNFGATKEGNLKITLPDVELVNNAEGNGYKIRFASLSSKKYKNREGSQMADFLRACGIPVQPKTNEEMKAAFKMASNRQFQFQGVWEAYNKDTQTNISGEASFPLGADGKRQSFIIDEFDPSKKWYANLKIKYTISALGKE